MEEEIVEVDSTKECWQRWAHWNVVGVDRPTGRMCPACMPDDPA